MTVGYPGQPNHPAVQNLVDEALQKIREAGVAAGTVAADGLEVRQLFERGFQFALVSVAKMLSVSAQELLTQAWGGSH